jgi:DNA-binding winged helix-turn-helix (wHTH) protein
MDALHNAGALQPVEHGFTLDALEVDPQEGLVSGPGGCEKLDPKVMAVLLLLTHHKGQIVSRDELLAQLWPKRIVTEDAVTRCFYVLRRQLCQAGGDPRYRALIETLPKRGYRLNGEIARLERQTVAAPIKAGGHRSVAIAIAVSAAVALIVVGISSG